MIEEGVSSSIPDGQSGVQLYQFLSLFTEVPIVVFTLRMLFLQKV